MDEAGNHHYQQTNTGTGNQTLNVLTYKWELNNENACTQRKNNTNWGPFRDQRVGGEGGSGKITNGY